VDFTVRHFLLPLMRAQREWGFEVEAACSPGEFVPQIEAEGFKVRPIQIARSKNPLKLFESYRGLARLFRECEYEVVHTHTPVASLVGRPAARRAGVPVVLYTAHGFYFHDRMKPLTRSIYVNLERRAQRYADYLFTQSSEDAETATREAISAPDRTLAIGNGVDLSRFRPDLLSPDEKRAALAEFGITPDHGPVVTMMGRLVREKGYLELIEAWAVVARAHPNARLLIIGDALPSEHDAAPEEIRARAKELHLDSSIIFAGLRSDVPRLLAASDIFVLPSWREGMPRSIIEAMGAGLPVIATDIRGCREEVVHDSTGLLVPVQNPNALAIALNSLIADETRRRAMGVAGRDRALAHFSEQAVIEKQRRIYEQIFREKKIVWPND